MKIIINKCWGGFGLSHKAVMRYAELCKFKLYPVVEVRDAMGKLDFNHFKNYNGEKAFSIHYSKKPLNVDGTYKDDSYFSPHDIPRNDKNLVKVVSEMGTKSWGEHAELRIVSIPNGIKWEIDEYDGQESVEEVHRSWG